MTPRMTTFQGIILGVFGVFIVLGVVIFAMSANSNREKAIGPVVIWGTLDGASFARVITKEADDNPALHNVTYIEKDPATFDEELSEALASGTGPDLFLLEQQSILRHQGKLAVFPYSTLPQQTYTSMYIDEAKLYLTKNGALGIPLLVDPLVLYSNKDTLSQKGFAQAPAYWDDVFTMAESVSEKDASGGIIKGTIAMGQFDNVLHAKDIVSTLVMQAGGNIISADNDGRLEVAIDKNVNNAEERPSISALRFYTTFANPAESIYSWNRALPQSIDAFSQGKVALYIGYASELPLIKQLNPNLNSEVSALPQIRDSNRSVTFGHMYALAKPRVVHNSDGADTIASIIGSSQFASDLSAEYNLPPVRRDLLSGAADGPLLVFYKAALVAVAWLDPAPGGTDAVFKTMIESVGSGSARITEAVDKAAQGLGALLQ